MVCVGLGWILEYLQSIKDGWSLVGGKTEVWDQICWGRYSVFKTMQHPRKSELKKNKFCLKTKYLLKKIGLVNLFVKHSKISVIKVYIWMFHLRS